MVWWLRLCASNAGSMSSIPSWETNSPHAEQCSWKIKKKKIIAPFAHLGWWFQCHKWYKEVSKNVPTFQNFGLCIFKFIECLIKAIQYQISNWSVTQIILKIALHVQSRKELMWSDLVKENFRESVFLKKNWKVLNG